MVKKIKDVLKPLENKSLSILGLTFKPNTDDMRESPSLVIIPELVKVVKNINVYDPAGMPIAKKMKEFTGVNWKNSTYECIKNTDGIVILTEWNEFRALDFEKVKNLLNQKVIIDLRNIYKPASMIELGFKYISVGRGS
jgi:UDPglucose 6-dehydrogenase